jgi:hypothetical protein
MSTKKPYYIMVMAIIFIIIAWTLISFFLKEPKEFQLAPRERIVTEPSNTSGSEVGTGWSLKESSEVAVTEALEMALKNKQHKPPDCAVIFASSGSDLSGIITGARKLLGDKTKIFGGTSDSRAVMTNKGFVKVEPQAHSLSAPKRGLAVMTVTSRDIVIGVGTADFSLYPSAREAAKAALLRAFKSSGKSPREMPQIILATITRGAEEEALEGIGEVAGKEVPVLGGTAGGPKFGVFGESAAYQAGISLAVIYTQLPVGWVFEGGFDVQNTPRGLVTKVEGRAIVEIDHRPALDVYDEWMGGRVKKLFEEVQDFRRIKDLLTLHPFYRRYTSRDGQDYYLFSHPWPQDQTLKDRSIMTSTNIKVGEEIHLSHGTWERLINRIGNLPLKARMRGGLGSGEKPVLGIGYLCAGVMGAIPEAEREKLSLLINYTNNDAPFIANFTWGEQGHFPRIGNKHGNLLTSFLVIMEKESK